jgi:HAE1 family hydrophobic/amphiphilic exporter-1
LSDLSDFENIIVGYNNVDSGNTQSEKAPVYLKNVAKITFANKDPENIVHLNGKRCLGLAVYKETRFNTVKAVEDITKELDNIEKALPGYQFTVVSNQGTFISSAIARWAIT